MAKNKGDESDFEKSFDTNERTGKAVAFPAARGNPTQTAEAAMFFLAAGANYQEVAEKFGYSSSHVARLAVEKALAAQVTNADKDALRGLALVRYEKLYRSVATRAMDVRRADQLAYNQRAQHLVDRYVALLGLQAPTQVQITPTGAQFEEVLAGVKAALGLGIDAAPEADIIDVYPEGYEEEGDPDA